MPDSQVKAVVALFGWPGLRTPVMEIGRSVLRTVKLVIARGGMRAAFEAAPSPVVTVGKLCGGAFFVGQIARSEDFTGYFIDKLCGCLRAREVLATGDVPRTHQDVGLAGGCGFALLALSSAGGRLRFFLA